MTRNVQVTKHENEELKNYKECSRVQLQMANNSYKHYEKYIAGDLSGLEEYDLNGMRVLYILENLGFSIYKLGTHFYKDAIMDVFSMFYYNNHENMMNIINESTENIHKKMDDVFIMSKVSQYKRLVDISSNSIDLSKINNEFYEIIYKIETSSSPIPVMNVYLVKEIVRIISTPSLVELIDKTNFTRIKKNK